MQGHNGTAFHTSAFPIVGCRHLRAQSCIGIVMAEMMRNRCIQNATTGIPLCNIKFDYAAYLTGISQIKQMPPGGTLSFVSCELDFDGTAVIDSDCFIKGDGHYPTHLIISPAMVTIPFLSTLYRHVLADTWSGPVAALYGKVKNLAVRCTGR